MMRKAKTTKGRRFDPNFVECYNRSHPLLDLVYGSHRYPN